MSAAAIVKAALAAHGPLTALVGDRIFPVVVPEFDGDGVPVVLPAIAYARSNTQYDNTIHGTAPLAASISYDLIAVAKKPIDCETLGDILDSIGGVLLPVNRVDEYNEDAGTFAQIVTVEVFDNT